MGCGVGLTVATAVVDGSVVGRTAVSVGTAVAGSIVSGSRGAKEGIAVFDDVIAGGGKVGTTTATVAVAVVKLTDALATVPD